MLLLIDNYDSFTFNLARYLRRLSAEVQVVRNDENNLAELAGRSQAIVLSPGPCGPEQAGECLEIVRRFTGQIPILGVCLGHQVICQAFGGHVIRAAKPIHGRALPVQLEECRLFENIEPIARFARYHSLVADADSLPECLRVTARSVADKSSDSNDLHESAIGYPLPTANRPQSTARAFQPEIMAVEHREHRTFGVQFHPESILSSDGYRLLSNFLSLSGWSLPTELPESDLA